jgi:CO dehydrogenase maturation factor
MAQNQKSSSPIMAICGKGGAGKTVLCALLARALLDRGVRPLLLIDADPAGGLCGAVGEQPENTLAGARENLIKSARNAGEQEKQQLADQLDYMVHQALLERPGYALLAMGRSRDAGCFCPANTLLRQAIDAVSHPFAVVLIDAEAGLEQIARRVTRSVTLVIAVSDGSQRSLDTMAQMHAMIGETPMAAVFNHTAENEVYPLPPGVGLLGCVPHDEQVRDYDRAAQRLWQLPEGNPARAAASAIAQRLIEKMKMSVIS